MATPAAVIVAVAGVPEDHVTELVRFWVLLSLKVPVAVNCCVAPLVKVGFAGVTAIDFNVAAVTVTVMEPPYWPTAGITYPPVRSLWHDSMRRSFNSCNRAAGKLMPTG